MSWANIIQKVDKEKRDWGKASATHIQGPKDWWVECEHEYLEK